MSSDHPGPKAEQLVPVANQIMSLLGLPFASLRVLRSECFRHCVAKPAVSASRSTARTVCGRGPSAALRLSLSRDSWKLEFGKRITSAIVRVIRCCCQSPGRPGRLKNLSNSAVFKLSRGRKKCLTEWLRDRGVVLANQAIMRSLKFDVSSAIAMEGSRMSASTLLTLKLVRPTGRPVVLRGGRR